MTVGKVLVICGATATGKTALAAECAKTLGSAVISADSQLVYRGLDIGTAKPTDEEKLGVPHYMIDVAEPDREYSVSDYKNSALPIVENLLSYGKVPVICGGTGFYINSLLFDLSYGNVAANDAVRQKYEELAAERGREYVYEMLRSVDPESAAKLHCNDLKRVVRALEIYEVGGKRKSEINDRMRPRFEYVAVAVHYPREQLYERIDMRVDKMFEAGLVDEVRGLLARGIGTDCRSMQAIGYKEVLEYLENGDMQCNVRDIIKRNTRRYAKRHITFFKKQLPGLITIGPEQANASFVLKLLNDGV